jgi:hypothetical protein
MRGEGEATASINYPGVRGVQVYDNTPTLSTDATPRLMVTIKSHRGWSVQNLNKLHYVHKIRKFLNGYINNLLHF